MNKTKSAVKDTNILRSAISYALCSYQKLYNNNICAERKILLSVRYIYLGHDWYKHSSARYSSYQFVSRDWLMYMIFLQQIFDLGHHITNKRGWNDFSQYIGYLSNLNRHSFGYIPLLERFQLDYWKIPKWLVLSIQGNNHGLRTQTGLFKPNWLTIGGYGLGTTR